MKIFNLWNIVQVNWGLCEKNFQSIELVVTHIRHIEYDT